MHKVFLSGKKVLQISMKKFFVELLKFELEVVMQIVADILSLPFCTVFVLLGVLENIN